MQDHQDVYLRLYLSAFKDGLVADLGASNFVTLLTIASFMDKNGQCFPTQQQIADRMGVHVNTANRCINALLKYRVDGKPILSREKRKQVGGCFSSLYTIHPLSQVAIFDSKVERIHQNSERTPQNSERSNHQNGDVTISNDNYNQNKLEPIDIWSMTEEQRMLRLLDRLERG